MIWFLAACSSPEPPVSVFVASSLTEVFQDLAQRYESENPEADLVLSFAGSQVLRLQIEQGAPADLFVSADLEHLRALEAEGRVARLQELAKNELVVVHPRENPAQLHRFQDLRRARRVVIGVSTSPIGRYTATLFQRAEKQLGRSFVTELQDHVVSTESNVRLVRAKVELGEADAAIIYRTDATARVGVVDIPPAIGVRTTTAIAEVVGSPHPQLAQDFKSFVCSEEGQQVLQQHGLQVPN